MVLITHICISSAKLNVVVNNLATIMNTILLLPYPLRILFGPLPIEVDIFAYLPVYIFLLSQVVIVAYYNIRLVLTLTISLLTAKTVLMTLFILRFDTMTGIQCHVSSIHNLGIHVYPSFIQLYQIF